jgi:single-strand DNA-binding protein
MPSFNNCSFGGHLGTDIEARHAQSGSLIANARLAVQTGWGEKKSTLWLTITAFGKTAERMVEWGLAKGSLILVSGKLEEQVWEKQDGGEGRKLCLIVSDFSNFTPREDGDAPAAKPAAKRKAAAPKTDEDYGDDSIPF